MRPAIAQGKGQPPTNELDIYPRTDVPQPSPYPTRPPIGAPPRRMITPRTDVPQPSPYPTRPPIGAPPRRMITPRTDIPQPSAYPTRIPHSLPTFSEFNRSLQDSYNRATGSKDPLISNLPTTSSIIREHSSSGVPIIANDRIASMPSFSEFNRAIYMNAHLAEMASQYTPSAEAPSSASPSVVVSSEHSVHQTGRHHSTASSSPPIVY